LSSDNQPGQPAGSGAHTHYPESVASRPPEEIGCLYCNASQREFVDPREVTDGVPHFSRPGSVLPRIVA